MFLAFLKSALVFFHRASWDTSVALLKLAEASSGI